MEEAEVEAFRAWLPGGRVNQKRADALAMLRLMKTQLEEKPEPKRPSFFLEHTVVWDRAAASATVDTDVDEGPSEVPLASLLEELRIDGSAYARARQGALIRHLGLAEAERQWYTVDAEAIAAVEDRFRRRRGLRGAKELGGWLRSNRISRERFDELMREEALLAETRARSAREELRRLPDHLLLSGEYARLRERAADKRRLLEDNGLENPTQEDVGMPAEALVNWYFRKRLGRSVREDNEGYSANAELARDDVDAFVRAVMREFCYLRLKGRLMQDGDSTG